MKLSIHDSRPEIRRKAIFRLKKNEPTQALKILRQVIKTDPSPVIRHEAAFILGTYRTRGAVSLLIEVIKNDHSDLVRHEAIEALGDSRSNSKNIVKLLTLLTKDRNPFIKDTAVIALATLQRK
jgi:HEAT repeat protein